MSGRTVEFELCGVKYPLCFTLQAVEDFYTRYGDVDGWYGRLAELNYRDAENPGEPIKLYAELLWLLETLMKAGYDMASYVDGETPLYPDMDELRNLLCVGDLSRVQAAVVETVSLGNQREVGAQAPKNGEGASDGELAPRS